MNSQMVPKSERRARWGPACGVLFVVILAVGVNLSNTPDTNKSPAYILAWYNKSSHKTQLGISTLLVDIAVVFGLFWFGYLRDRFSRTDVGARFAPILMAGATIFGAGGLIFSGASIALLDSPKHMSADTAQTLNFLQSDIGGAAVEVGVSILLLAAWVIIWKTRILPVWVGWVALVLGVVALAGPIGFFGFIGSGIWFLIVAYFMWRYEMRLPASEGAPAGPSPAVSAETTG
jgi:hypothetical protein